MLPTREDLYAFEDEFQKLVALLPPQEQAGYADPPGTGQSRFLAWAARNWGSKHILEVGTWCGHSALSLSIETSREVDTWDIKENKATPATIHGRQNISFCLGNLLDDQTLVAWDDYDLIFLDITHNGLDERFFINILDSVGWKGTLILDDIHLNPQMEGFWNDLQRSPRLQTYDATALGHSSGTGVVTING